MKFGIGLFSLQTHPKVQSSYAEICRNTLEQVKLAEKVNFDSAWISEHHFLEDGYCPSPSVLASAMAAVTSRIKIGSAGIILPLQNPIRVAEDAALVDNISNGRFNLGVVLGYRKEEFDGFGISMRERPSRMDEGIEVIIKSWTEDKFSYTGKRYQFSNVSVTPKPVQKPHIPFYIGAFEEPAIRRAGRLGYPLIIGPGRTMQMVRETVNIYNDAARQAGKNPDGIEHILLREAYVAKSKKKAKKEADQYIISMYKYYFSLGVKMFVRGQQLTGLDDPMFDYLPEDRFVIGDPEDCINELKRYRDELGINYIACRMVFPSATHKTISNCIKLFGREVIPNIR
ncbi:MAG TPA: LLM class flavin-dependent oxidoreductase [Thermodesulfobacteriota bacterium]|nr:LLM class flavin-dependent oxidoreductase [Thermodesulfobacteriota bacterium]